MKKLITLVIVIAFILALTPAVLAATPGPGGPYNSAFRVQNLEATQASCSYVFYDQAGTAAYTSASTNVAPGDSLYVYLPSITTLAAGTYSGVVSCDKKVGAVVNFSDAQSGASHNGITDVGTTWYAPGIYNNYYNFYSNIVVQNATSGPVDITVDILQPGSTTPVATQTKTGVPANASWSFEQEGLAGLLANQFYSAKVTATGNVAPIVNIYGKGPVLNQLYSYNAFTAGSTTAYAPIIMKNYYGYNTALVVQNMGSAAADVTVDYTNGHSDNYNIQPGAAVSIYTPSIAGITAGNTLYGATVTSNNGQPIVVLVNQSNAYDRAASYTGFAAGSTEVRAPIVEKHYYTFDSSVVCQNVGGSATTMTIKYAGIAGQFTTPSVDAGATWQFYQPADALLASVPPNWIGSATVTSGQPIVCVVNQDNIPSLATQVKDNLYSYDGIAP